MRDRVSCSYGIGWRDIYVRLLEMVCSRLEVCSRVPDI